jgi:hypothetical protein
MPRNPKRTIKTIKNQIIQHLCAQFEQPSANAYAQPTLPSRKEENAQKLKQNEFFASHAHIKLRISVARYTSSNFRDLCIDCLKKSLHVGWLKL